MDPKIERRINCLIIFVAAVFFKTCIALTINPFSADGCLYMNIARNFARGAGFYCSYNFYQYWDGHTILYPALVFMHPLFPLLAGIVWFFFHSLAAVKMANVYFSGFNCLVLYLIVERMYNSRVALFSALLAAVSFPMVMTATLPWSEQMHLFFVLIALWWVADGTSYKKWYNILLAGIMLGVSYLVRVSGLYNLFIFSGVFIAFFGFSKKTLKLIFLLWLGFFIIMVPYEIFCCIKYHIFYPEYPVCARVFNASRTLGGSYFFTKPVLRLPADFKFDLFGLFSYNFPRHLASFATVAVKYFNFLILAFLARTIYIYKRKRFDENLLFWIGMGNILLFSTTFFWLSTDRLETHRYFLIPLVCWIPLGVAALYDAAQMLREDLRKSYSKFYFLVLMILLLCITGYQGIELNQFSFIHMRQLYNRETKDQAMFKWVMKHSAASETIATSEYQVAFDLDRPVVSLPEGRVINDLNMKDFLKIYHPKYILLSRPYLPLYKEFLDKNCRQEPLPSLLGSSYVVYKLN